MNSYRRRWLTLVMVLSGAMLLQTPTACQTVLANSLTGLVTSITNVFIYNSVLNAFGFPTLGGNLGSNLTSGLTSSLTGTSLTGVTGTTGTTGTTGLGT